MGGQSMGIPTECEGALNIAKLNTNCRGLRVALQDAPMVAKRDSPLRTAVLIKRFATLMTSWPPRPASAPSLALGAKLRDTVELTRSAPRPRNWRYSLLEPSLVVQPTLQAPRRSAPLVSQVGIHDG